LQYFGEEGLGCVVDLPSIFFNDVALIISRQGRSEYLVTTYIFLSDRFDFQREVSTLRCLNDPNIVRLLGVVAGGMRQGDVASCIVTEYMLFGDLKQFLQRHQALEGTISRTACSTMARVNSLRFVARTCSHCSVGSQSRWADVFLSFCFASSGCGSWCIAGGRSAVVCLLRDAAVCSKSNVTLPA
jgi:hypothetical protein